MKDLKKVKYLILDMDGCVYPPKFLKKLFKIIGFETEANNEISDKNLLALHLSHRTVENFNYIPNENTSKDIWKYLASTNLLEKVENINLEDIEKYSKNVRKIERKITLWNSTIVETIKFKLLRKNSKIKIDLIGFHGQTIPPSSFLDRRRRCHGAALVVSRHCAIRRCTDPQAG